MSKNKEKEPISREQIVLWSYDAGFPTNYARNEITRFETFAKLVEKHVNSDIYKENTNGTTE
jgi:hypothetical protein